MFISKYYSDAAAVDVIKNLLFLSAAHHVHCVSSLWLHEMFSQRWCIQALVCIKNTVAQIWKLNDRENIVVFLPFYICLHHGKKKSNSVSFSFICVFTKLADGDRVPSQHVKPVSAATQNQTITELQHRI